MSNFSVVIPSEVEGRAFLAENKPSANHHTPRKLYGPLNPALRMQHRLTSRLFTFLTAIARRQKSSEAKRDTAPHTPAGFYSGTHKNLHAL
jgi:hypothetical protein